MYSRVMPGFSRLYHVLCHMKLSHVMLCYALVTYNVHALLQHSKKLPSKKQALLHECNDARRLAAAAFQHLEKCDAHALANMAWSQATIPLGPPEFLPKVVNLCDCQ